MDDTAVSSESKNPPLVQAKDKSEDTPRQRAERWLKNCFPPPGVRFQLCCDGDGHTDSSSDSSDDDDDESPVIIGRAFPVPTHLEHFVEEMTSGSGPYNENTNSVLVTNLPILTGSRRTNGSDLLVLFGTFGATDAHVARDKDGIPGRFGFVKFATREQARKAIDNGGFIYRNFTLGVEWVTPKTT